MARAFSSQRLRSARLAAGLKPEHVALSIDRSSYSVREYELGRVTPPAEILGQLADLYGCTIDGFFVESALEVAA